MLPLLAGLAGLALVGNPFRAKRRSRSKGVTPSAAGARRTLTYGQRSRLSKRIAFEYLKAIKAGKRRRSR